MFNRIAFLLSRAYPISCYVQEPGSGNNNNITINAASFTDSDLSLPAGLERSAIKSYKLPADSYLLINISGTSIPEPVGNTLTTF
jgi:hypothetical protein